MKKQEEKQKKRLEFWQNRVNTADTAFSSERIKMDEREEIYRGRKRLDKISTKDEAKESEAVWNITYEMIEAQVDAQLPSPKVTALHKKDEHLAILIEDFCRNKLDEQPSEVINDQMERSVPMQGGGLFHIEWDDSQSRGTRQGLSVLSFIHPKQLTPQPGITSDIEDMDWCGLAVGVSKSFMKRRFGVDLSGDSEEDKGRRGAYDVPVAEDMLTWRIIYYRNEKGGIGRFSYVNDTVIEDYDDYQARRGRRCSKCGRLEPAGWNSSVEPIGVPTLDGSYPGGGTWREENGIFISDDAEPVESKRQKGVCPWCGSGKFEDSELEYEEIWNDVEVRSPSNPDEILMTIPGAKYPDEAYSESEIGADRVFYEQEPTKIPFYKPDIFPLILMKNVSSWGHLLGESDIDKIAPQQNAINRLNQKMMDALLSGGSYLTLPADPSLKVGSEELKVFRPKNAADLQYIDVKNIQPNISQIQSAKAELYQQARDTIGITDSFQGKHDSTATSGTAKEVSIAQAAGRFQSKRVMKRYFWSRLFEAMFKFELAYADDDRPVVGMDGNGIARDETWSKWLFVRKNEETGEYYWNTDFNFSVDQQSALASDRTAMWKETREYYLGGAFGNPQDIRAQIMFWLTMEKLHYPNAAEIKKQLIERQKADSSLQAKAAEMQLQAQEAAKKEASMETGGLSP